MEKYSPTMALAAQQQLRQASPDYLALLAPGFLQRQGPGLRLLRLEYRRRNLPFPPAHVRPHLLAVRRISLHLPA